MSSVVNKSGKKFMPRAAPRRRQRTPTPPPPAPTSAPESLAVEVPESISITETIESDGTTVLSTIAPPEVAEQVVDALRQSSPKRRKLTTTSPVLRSSEVRQTRRSSSTARDRPSDNRRTGLATPDATQARATEFQDAVVLSEGGPPTAELVRVEFPPTPDHTENLHPDAHEKQPEPVPEAQATELEADNSTPHTETVRAVTPSIEEPPVVNTKRPRGSNSKKSNNPATELASPTETDDANVEALTTTAARKAPTLRQNVEETRATEATSAGNGMASMVSLTPADFENSGPRKPRKDKGRPRKKPSDQDQLATADKDPATTAGAEAPESEQPAETPAKSARQLNAEKRRQKAAAKKAATNRGGAPDYNAIAAEVIAASKKAVQRKARNAEATKERANQTNVTEEAPQVHLSIEGLEAGADGVDGADGDEASEPRARRQRKPTPEGAEAVTIVPSVVTMYELAARNIKTGWKSEREKLMSQIDWKEVKERRKAAEYKRAMEGNRYVSPSAENEQGNANGEEVEEEEIDDEEIDRRLEAAATRSRVTQRTLRMKVVNGQHFIDESSQFVNRNAMADVDVLEEVEEDDLTKHFNSHSYQCLRRKEPAERVRNWDRWTQDTTDFFYDCLTRFGTDFMIISKCFPGRTRREIKSKFVREERLDPDRVKEALTGSLTGGASLPEGQTWDLDEFTTAAQLDTSDLRDPAQLEEMLRKRREEREAEIEEARKEAQELKRMKKLAGVESSDDEDGGVAGGIGFDDGTGVGRKGKKKKKKSKKKKKEKFGGAEVEVMEEIEDD